MKGPKSAVYLDRYFHSVYTVFRRIRETQRAVIEQAAETVAMALSRSGALLVMDTGHMLRHEAFTRAGGLVAWTPFSYAMDVDCPIDHRKTDPLSRDTVEMEARTVALALDQSKIRRGDVLIINSNSGRSSNVVELALQCKTRGVTTIGISSSEQMRRCSAVHPSGKKLFDVADFGIDNCTPFGDASVEVKDNEKMCPLSGLAATYILWAIQADAVERLQERGVNPTIYRSVHVSGPDFVEEQRRKYLERGI